MPIGEPTNTGVTGATGTAIADIPTGGVPPTQSSPAYQDIVNTILSQLQPTIAGSQLSSTVAGNQLDLNSALYGPGGLYQQQLQTQYGYNTANLGLSNQGIEQQLGIGQQQQGIEQQQYGIGQQQYDLQQQGLQQQLAENANQYGQAKLSQYGNAAAQGATNTVGNANQLGQIGLYYGPGGYNEQSINRQLANLGLTEQNAGLGQQSEQLNYLLNQSNLQRALQSNNISGQELLTGLNQGIQSLGMQGATSADQILQQLAQGYEQMAPGIASAISDIGVAGGIPQLITP